ncbi:hypothetical protein EJ076_33870 [Mesorhizobium sp. M7D.F.Ca.US.005.01.1.1]|uniref:hypothetical protein n=1 Tax=Mesorhizobium sp. M7D.F.Ca.US.005.01.1.1 TaxID=2493678 RepID=UPI000F75582A|nr:hypothetical protein [Mesorhizobium sp. M7D.F.Ca.US.005.01.1.1]AZO45710.1 hypothetical protein EJ076_33870 [Mesorhizobium sp. M7D.F.Ca.US.005.01.1.1]
MEHRRHNLQHCDVPGLGKIAIIAGFNVVLRDNILDSIYEIVPPAPMSGRSEMAYNPAILKADLHRRPLARRAAG